jgi:drug/metabolite transporter (DMT)-like permease
MGEIVGVLAGLLSNALGGTGIGVTRYVIRSVDPLTLGALRFGIGFLVLVPIMIAQGGKWPVRADWAGIAALGILFFALYPIVFNFALMFTTAAHAALALSTIPLLSMVIGAAIGVEPLTGRKTAGVLVAMVGITMALLQGLRSAPPEAWIGDLSMMTGALCFALYNVLSRPFAKRSGAIPFTTMAMGVGAVSLIVVALARDGLQSAAAFGPSQWFAVGYLGIIGAAGGFVLWAFALTRTTPTRVAISVPVNPITASLVAAAMIGEPIGWNLVLGLITVFLGIWIAIAEKDTILSSTRRYRFE